MVTAEKQPGGKTQSEQEAPPARGQLNKDAEDRGRKADLPHAGVKSHLIKVDTKKGKH